jgi:glutamyl-Q tRNA(Asp) synthetase
MITRFAPSPTGLLHLGHAFSALTAWNMAQAAGGTFLLRIEDIDQPRCRPDFEAAIGDDLHWLGLDWPLPVMRQSERRAAYDDALARLAALGVTYPCSCTRADIRAALSAPQEGSGPDGPVYPGTCRGRSIDSRRPDDAIRLDMARAMALTGPLAFNETGAAQHGAQSITAAPMCDTVGDVVLARKDIGTSYHLAVVVDDGAQGVTHVVRGQDLFTATPIHVLLQRLLGLPTPLYHHHRLIRDEHGQRLAKRDDARAIRAYRDAGHSPLDIRQMVGL